MSLIAGFSKTCLHLVWVQPPASMDVTTKSSDVLVLVNTQIIQTVIRLVCTRTWKTFPLLFSTYLDNCLKAGTWRQVVLTNTVLQFRCISWLSDTAITTALFCLKWVIFSPKSGFVQLCLSNASSLPFLHKIFLLTFFCPPCKALSIIVVFPS